MIFHLGGGGLKFSREDDLLSDIGNEFISRNNSK